MFGRRPRMRLNPKLTRPSSLMSPPLMAAALPASGDGPLSLLLRDGDSMLASQFMRAAQGPTTRPLEREFFTGIHDAV